MIEAKAFRTLIRIYSLLRSERLSINIKLTLHKAVIRIITTYVCSAWEFAADTPTKLCRQQAEVIQNDENTNVRNVGQGETRHRKYKRLKLSGGQEYYRSSD
jgi:hypothetical protein